VTIDSFPKVHRQRICDVVAEAVTGNEMGALLQSLGVDDSQAGITTLHRLFAALSAR
jgi:hypothetical protein